MTLKELRKARGLTWQALGAMAGIHWTSIAKLERGEISLDRMTVKNYMSLCDALEVDPKIFYEANKSRESL